MDILNLLVRESYVSAEDVQKAKEYAEKQHAAPIDYLLKEGLISKSLLGQAVAESLDVPFADLSIHQPSEDQIARIPEDVARQLRVVMFAENEKAVAIATDNPKQPVTDLTPLFSPKTVRLAYALPEDIDDILRQYRKPLQTRFSSIIESGQKVAPEIIDEIFEDALTFDASDVHLEPQAEFVLIRFRVDGVLQEAGQFEKQYYENVLNRIKVMSHLRIDEHFSVQDGAIRFESQDKTIIDLRISVAPTIDGEKVAIRFLNAENSGLNLTDLGLSPNDQKTLQAVSRRPFGMILVTGPTGSGKTTSLYSVLKLIKKTEINITTIEDPVEYRVPGINQIQVNPETDITFAEGLRSIVRQDPDVILVGEIRDQETAEIAVNAALTGHLLLSTFHANDAATAIPRLLDMGIEPFLLSSTLDLIIAQRLVRRICETCRYGKEFSKEEIDATYPEIKQYFEGEKITLYQGKGCKTCHGVGYKGRMAIF